MKNRAKDRIREVELVKLMCIQVLGIDFAYESDNLSLRDVNENNMFSFWLLHSSTSVMLLLFFSFLFFFFLACLSNS